MQVFLSLLPAGPFFHPILDDVLQMFGIFQSKALKEVQLNAQTTGLVEYMRTTNGFDHPITITGHSLGGGISLITGALAKIPAISFSGTFFFYLLEPELEKLTVFCNESDGQPLTDFACPCHRPKHLLFQEAI